MKKIYFLLLFSPVVIHAQVITTIAGVDTAGYGGDGGLSINAALNGPQGITTDNKGNVYFAEVGNSCIRKISATGIISTVAGNGTAGYGGDNGPATSAMLNEPHSVAVDTSGNIYIGDYYNHRIRKVDAVTGIITTIAGTGIGGYNGTNRPAKTALLYKPSGIVVDDIGNIYLSDYYNNRVRKIDTAGIISNIAGSGGYGYSGDHGPATVATMKDPYSVAIDRQGNIYVTDIWNYCVRKVDATGNITTIVGNGISGYSGDGYQAVSAELDVPQFAAVDKKGNVYIADARNQRIRMVDTAGVITTIAGSGAYGYNGDNIDPLSADLDYPAGVAVDNHGNVYISDQGNNRIRFIAALPDVQPILKNSAAINVYPNPVTSEITVKFDRKITNMTIINLMGQIVFAHVYNSEEVQADLSSLPSGVYFIKINGIEMTKFVKK